MNKIDWSLAPEGVIKYAKMKDGNRGVYYWLSATGYWVIDDVNYTDYYEFELESSSGENFTYNEFDILHIKKDKPLYTTKMQEAGELPSVGASCMIYYNEPDSRYNDFFDCEIEILAITGDVFTFSNPLKGLGALKLDLKTIKPLTPPVELLDGKAYQFDYKGSAIDGIYDDNGKVMWAKGSPRHIDNCTNIKLLGVK